MDPTELSNADPRSRLVLAAARDVRRNPASDDAAERGGVDFAVVVGVEHYAHCDPLRGAHNDAQRFHEWLCDPDGGGIEWKYAKLILSDPKARTPVQDEIDQALADVLDMACHLGGARRLYFYFSGHGATGSALDDDVSLLLTRWSTQLARLALSTGRYSRVLGGAGAFEEVAIFADCCRSLAISAVGLPPTITRVCEALPRTTRTFVAFAAEARRPAYSAPCAGLWRGIFTYCLLEILRRAPNGVSANELKDLLEREVERAAEGHGLSQSACVNHGFRGDSRFGRRGIPPMLELRFAGWCGRVTLRCGDGQVMATHEAGDEPWRVRVTVGLYSIERDGEPVVFLDHDGQKVQHDV
jgi:hypothetical protein